MAGGESSRPELLLGLLSRPGPRWPSTKGSYIERRQSINDRRCRVRNRSARASVSPRLACFSSPTPSPNDSAAVVIISRSANSHPSDFGQRPPDFGAPASHALRYRYAAHRPPPAEHTNAPAGHRRGRRGRRQRHERTCPCSMRSSSPLGRFASDSSWPM